MPRGQLRDEEKEPMICQSDPERAEQGEAAVTWIVQKTLNQ